MVAAAVETDTSCELSAEATVSCWKAPPFPRNTNPKSQPELFSLVNRLVMDESLLLSPIR